MTHNSFCPSKYDDDYDYIKNNISENRYDHLFDLAHRTNGKLKIALRDVKTNYWTKWLSFFTNELKGGISINNLEMAHDVHRSLLPNELVIESDYPDYKDNVDASRLIGEMIESKGFIPHYYYSGSKSIHIHIFIDFGAFGGLSEKSFECIQKYFDNKELFFEKFLIWLRALMISCWGFNLKEFDRALIQSTHLIRAELSLNKFGHKTFLGYTHKDLTDKPFICNHKTGNIPSITTQSTCIRKNQFEMKESVPDNLDSVVAEFLDYYDKVYRLDKNERKSSSLLFSNAAYKPTKLRKNVNIIMNDDFVKTKDGMKRALFILCNEIKQIHSESESIELLRDWNVRMGNPFRDHEILFRVRKSTNYRLKNDYINSFLREVGVL